MARAQLQDSDSSQYWAIMNRLKRLEGASGKKLIEVASLSSIDLGAIDGDGITAVRINLVGKVVGNTGNTFIRLRPNGLSSFSASSIAERTSWPSGGPQGHDVVYGSNATTTSGFLLCATDWGARDNAVKAYQTLDTRVDATSRRHLSGIYSNQDIEVDANNLLSARVLTEWNDNSTVITSLLVSIDSGTFTGRIVLEELP